MSLDLIDKIDTQTKRLGKFLPAVVQTVSRTKAFRPQPGPQTQFLTTTADVTIYGGAAGGGKTWGLLVDALKHVSNPGFGAVIFRRTYPQITNEGGMWDESNEIYPFAGGTPRVGDLDWRWTSGAAVSFRHLLYDKELLDWQGAQIAAIGWDQLEHFTAKQFWYMFSRNRSMCGVKPYVKATVNPDADSWVADLIAWWINQETGFPIPERAGKIRWFIRLNDEIIWGHSFNELFQKYGDPALPLGHPEQVQPKSLTFIPAKITDNQELLRKDPSYIANLKALNEVDRQRLLEGNWKVKHEAGKIFNRDWFRIIRLDEVPLGGKFCRGWDFAATAKKIKEKPKGDGPDYTADCLIQHVNGIYIVHEANADQIAPIEADARVKRRARKDGTLCKVRWEEEPGASGKRDSAHLIRMLAGYDCKGIRPKGDKYQRSKGLARQAEEGNVWLLNGEWNKRWLNHMHGQPDLPHDDEHDAASVAFNGVTFMPYAIPQSQSKRLFKGRRQTGYKHHGTKKRW